MNVPKVKEFLDGLKALGSIRIITNNGVAVRCCCVMPHWLPPEASRPAQVLESVTSFEGLFYADVPNKCVRASPAIARGVRLTE